MTRSLTVCYQWSFTIVSPSSNTVNRDGWALTCPLLSHYRSFQGFANPSHLSSSASSYTFTRVYSCLSHAGVPYSFTTPFPLEKEPVLESNWLDGSFRPRSNKHFRIPFQVEDRLTTERHYTIWERGTHRQYVTQRKAFASKKDLKSKQPEHWTSHCSAVQFISHFLQDTSDPSVKI